MPQTQTDTENPRGTPGETPAVADLQEHPAAGGETPEALLEALRKEREKTKTLEKATKERERLLQELQDKERDREAATLTETQKKQREYEQALQKARDAEARATRSEDENRKLKIAHAVYLEAAERGFEYPQDVHRLIDPDAVAFVEGTDQVEAKSVRDAVERLAKSRPGLLRARTGGGTPPRDVPRRALGEGGAPPPPLHGRGDPALQELESTGRYGGRM